MHVFSAVVVQKLAVSRLLYNGIFTFKEEAKKYERKGLA
jgi:hypothetical protein